MREVDLTRLLQFQNEKLFEQLDGSYAPCSSLFRALLSDVIKRNVALDIIMTN